MTRRAARRDALRGNVARHATCDTRHVRHDTRRGTRLDATQEQRNTLRRETRCGTARYDAKQHATQRVTRSDVTSRGATRREAQDAKHETHDASAKRETKDARATQFDSRAAMRNMTRDATRRHATPRDATRRAGSCTTRHPTRRDATRHATPRDTRRDAARHTTARHAARRDTRRTCDMRHAARETPSGCEHLPLCASAYQRKCLSPHSARTRVCAYTRLRLRLRQRRGARGLARCGKARRDGTECGVRRGAWREARGARRGAARPSTSLSLSLSI